MKKKFFSSTIAIATLLSFTPISFAEINDLPPVELGTQPTCEGLSGSELRICKIQRRTWKIQERQVKYQDKMLSRQTALEAKVDSMFKEIQKGFTSAIKAQQSDRRETLSQNRPLSEDVRMQLETQLKNTQRELSEWRRGLTPTKQVSTTSSTAPRTQTARSIRSAIDIPNTRALRACRTLPPREWQSCIAGLSQ